MGNKCRKCGGEDGQHNPIEVMGDGANFEWDVVGYKKCPNDDGEDYQPPLNPHLM